MNDFEHVIKLKPNFYLPYRCRAEVSSFSIFYPRESFFLSLSFLSSFYVLGIEYFSGYLLGIS